MGSHLRLGFYLLSLKIINSLIMFYLQGDVSKV